MLCSDSTKKMNMNFFQEAVPSSAKNNKTNFTETNFTVLNIKKTGYINYL